MSAEHTTTNTTINLLNSLLKNYYNAFIINSEDTVSPNTPYFFHEMKNILGSKDANVISESTNHPKENLNDFIRTCINWKLSTDYNVYDNLLKLYKINGTRLSTTVGPSQKIENTVLIKDIHRYINLINVIIEILEAYKTFIETNSAYKTAIKDIHTIQLVNKFSRVYTASTDPEQGYSNYGYIHEKIGNNTILMLSIESFNSDNSVFDQDLTYTTQIDSFTNFWDPDGASGAGDIKQNGTSYVGYKRQQVKLENNDVKFNSDSFNTNYFNTLDSATSIERRDKQIIKNVLYFLVRMNKDYARTQVAALYYYYKIVLYHILLTCASVSVAVNNVKVTSETLSHIKLIDSDNKNLFLTSNPNYIAKFLNIPVADIKTSGENIVNQYNIISKYVNEEMNKLVFNLFNFANSKKNSVINSIIDQNTVLTAMGDNINSKEIKIFYNTSQFLDQFKTIISDVANKNDLINKYVFVYEGKPYTIKDAFTHNSDTTKQYILIEAKYRDNTDETTSFIPTLPFDYLGSGTVMYRCKIMNKSLFTLKLEYIQGKNQLKSINSSIITNTAKINTQKTQFNNQQSKNTLLDNQIMAYNIILGVLSLAFICLFIFNIDESSKKLASFLFIGAILLIITVYYVLNSNYLEEDFTNIQYNPHKTIVENFNTIRTATDLITLPNSTFYNKNKIEFLSSNLREFLLSSLTLIQKVISILPTTDTEDFYTEINDIISGEVNDKQNIDEILSYKKSLGNSNIDVVKYEIHNKKVYLFCLLSTFFILSILYLISLFVPKDYGSLLIFIGVIITIIIFAYYLIFTHTLVRTKSMHKYWGPVYNNNL